MRRRVSLSLPLLLLGSLAAQQAPPPPAPLPPPSSIFAIPQALATLADQPATHTAFTFDRSMLQGADALIGPGPHGGASLATITVDTYRYPRPAFYSPEAMGSIIATFDAAGWKHLVNANATAAQSAQPAATITDLWLHFSGTDIDNLAVLTRGPRLMNLLQVSGDLRPIDLLHLAGHFGIPKVDPGAVMVPAAPGH